jgi:hypothetical protein
VLDSSQPAETVAPTGQREPSQESMSPNNLNGGCAQGYLVFMYFARDLPVVWNKPKEK